MTRPTSTTLARVPASARRARRLVVSALLAAGRDDAVQVGLAELLVSELATNAIRYGGGDDFQVEVAVTAGEVVVQVRDHSPQLPEPRHALPAEEGGRGLELVQTVATAWGTQSGAGGKVVWFRLGLDAALAI